jgi:UDP-glucose 4-epimerase
MHIYITGVAGFLGSNLADFYIKKGFQVSGCDSLIGGERENVNSQVTFIKGNCEDLDLMTRTMKNVDVVCHTAAYAHEGLSNISPTLITSNNVTGSVSVFTAAIRNKVKRIVYCSSMARYGKAKIPYHENSIPEPSDPYGVAKLAAEKILKILCNTHKVEYNIAVPHNIIGPKQKFDDPFRNVVSIMTNLMIQNREPVIYGDGEQQRCFSDVDDCIYCLDKLLTDENIKSELVNIGPDEETVTINELFKILSNKLKFNKTAKYFADRPNEVKKAICSSDKARRILGYKTKVSFDESLDKTIEYIKKKGPRNFQYEYNLEIDNETTPKTWKKKIF